MTHSFTQLNIHLIFAVKYRKCYLSENIEAILHPKIREILVEMGCHVLAIGGMADHVHVFLESRADLSVAQIVQKVKGASSHWLNEQNCLPGKFFWQAGYSAFTYSFSHREAVIQYIQNQKKHHRGWTFQDELMEIYRRFNMKFDQALLPESEIQQEGF